MEIRKYHLGLSEKNSLQDCGNGVLIYRFRLSDDEVTLECNKNENTMRMLKRSKNEDNFEEINQNEIEKGVINKLSDDDDGSRWEGDWFNGNPFGFGSVYDGEGNRIYSGFMFDGKKIGYGTEYFADNHKVDYCGNFINDKRHGWGITYDRNGQKLYEGNWRCGKNDFEDERIVIEDNCKRDDLRIHDLIKELEIGENCLNEWKGDLIITNYPNLQSIIVKKNSLRNLNSLKICNCDKLKTIEVEGGDIFRYNGAFNNVRNVIIESI